MTIDPKALELAREVIAKYGADADKPSVHLATALLAAHAEIERMRKVVEEACLWAHGMVEVMPGQFIDSDDGSCEPGLEGPPQRNVLLAAIAAYRKEPTT